MEVNIQNKISRKLKRYRFKKRYAPYLARCATFTDKHQIWVLLMFAVCLSNIFNAGIRLDIIF